ncbi:hypothetical protein TIFTF001_030099 [Ficus carica]|uniref:Uncharacterized protein n=1 Tax=Ficus carica TaxID=3494 RepID=A0AA88DT62_FICCA|nr:hypothetical protein TIFTF001_030099 [Ficus carica]
MPGQPNVDANRSNRRINVPLPSKKIASPMVVPMSTDWSLTLQITLMRACLARSSTSSRSVMFKQ